MRIAYNRSNGRSAALRIYEVHALARLCAVRLPYMPERLWSGLENKESALGLSAATTAAGRGGLFVLGQNQRPG
jgi:hypothetical protein